MKLVRPYGSSLTDQIQSDRLLLPKSGKSVFPTVPVKPTLFVNKEPKLVMALWISTIDKIIKKPVGIKNATPRQRHARQKLGDACWKVLCQNFGDMFPGPVEQKLPEQWDWKLHPYGNGVASEFENEDRIKGRWFHAFLYDEYEKTLPKFDEIQHGLLASRIYYHLHRHELKIDGNTRGIEQKPNIGFAERRTRSIELKTLSGLFEKNSDLTELTSAAWSPDDIDIFGSEFDLAACIYQTNEQLENCEERRRARKIFASEAGDHIFEHYGRVLGNKNDRGEVTSVPKRQELLENQSGVLEIYDAVRALYKRILKGSKKKSLIGVLPKNHAALLRRLGYRDTNKITNQLVRVGRVLHYEASEGDQDHFELGPDSPIWEMDIEKIAQSRYWTSDGQSEIKRAEAFVRVWRNALSQASRSAKNLCDPEDRVDNDVWSEDFRALTLSKNSNLSKVNEHLKLIFGREAPFFDDTREDQKREFLRTMLTIGSRARHEIFHFRGRSGFVSALKMRFSIENTGEVARNKNAKQTPLGSSDTQEYAHNLLAHDELAAIQRIRETVAGARIPEFCETRQLPALLTILDRADQTDITLPKFNRLLLRLENTDSVQVGPNSRNLLPKPGKKLDLEIAANLAKHTAFKLIYEGPFRNWLAERNHTEMNRWIKDSIRRSSEAAQSINSQQPHSKLMVSKATGLSLKEGQTISNFLEMLTAETASEMRVQAGYRSVGDKARDQADWIYEFVCDVIGRGFRMYILGLSSIHWLLAIQETTKANKPVGIPAAEPNENAEKRPLWQAYLYLLLHLVPVDDVSRLLHQFRKWGVLEIKAGNEDDYPDVAAMRKILALYLQMHDAKFDGDAVKIGLEPFRALYKEKAAFDELFLKPDAGDDVLDGTRRGLREIMRFGHLAVLKQATDTERVADDDIKDLEDLESLRIVLDPRSSRINEAQLNRKALHHQASTKANSFTIDDHGQYREILSTIVRHRQLAAHVRLINHTRLHGVLMRVMARLVDYAGIWERDGYFIALAIIKLMGKRPQEIFPFSQLESEGKTDTKSHRYLFTNLGRLRPEFLYVDTAFARILSSFHTLQHRQIRNDFAHLNILAAGNQPVNLTLEINRVRKLMAYDRKLKNAVSKSIIELLQREGLEIIWQMNSADGNHDLENARISSRTIEHIKKASKELTRSEIETRGLKPDRRESKSENYRRKAARIETENQFKIGEQFHNARFLNMITALFTPLSS